MKNTAVVNRRYREYQNFLRDIPAPAMQHILDERRYGIIQLRFERGETRATIAQKYGVSTSRIQQLEFSALLELRLYFQE